MKQISTVFFLIIFLGFYACNKTSTIAKETCSEKPYSKKQTVAFQFGSNDALNVNLLKWENQGKNLVASRSETGLDLIDFTKLTNILKQSGLVFPNQYGANPLVVNYTFYMADSSEGKKTFTLKDIQAIGLYIILNNRLYHNFYLNSDGQFTEVKFLESLVGGISLKDMYSISRTLNKQQLINVLTIALSDTQEQNKYNFKRGFRDGLELRIKLYESQLYNQNRNENSDLYELYKLAPGGSQDSCGGYCYSLVNHICEQGFPNSSYHCDKRFCPLLSSKNILDEAEVDNNLFATFDDMYALKDGFLMHSNRGKFYIDTYYYLTPYISDFSLSELTDCASLFVSEGWPKVLSFNEYNSRSNILYDNNTANNIKQKLQIFSNHIPPTDTLGVQIIDWYKDQIDLYTNMRIDSIRARFND